MQLNEIKSFAADKPLGDPSLSSSPAAVTLSSPSQTVNIPDPGNAAGTLGCFVLSGGAATSVAIVNASSDPDPAGYFNLGATAQPAAEVSGAAPAIEPPITFDPTLAYVVISGLSVSGKLAGSFTIGGPATLGLDGSLCLDAGACMAFPRATPAQDAVKAAADGFRSVFALPELLAPPPNPPATLQVLTVGVQGALSLSLTLTASSLTGTLADAINDALSTTGLFSFSAAPAATVTVSVGASDGYRLFAQKVPGGTQFSVKKCLSTSLGLNGGVGLTVTVTSPELDALVDSAIDQLVQNDEGTLQRLLASAATAVSGLSAGDQPKLAALLAKFKISISDAGALQELQAKVADLKADIASRLQALVCAQFTYTWQRLTSQSIVARFSVPDAVLPKYHLDILRLDLTRLLAAGPADGVVVSRILGQELQQVDVGYGFSFGLAGFTFLKSWDSLTLKFIELDSSGGGQGTLRQYSFLGKRAYQADWLKASEDQYVELDASTSVALPSPDVSDFQIRLSIAFSWKNRLIRDIVSEVADHGALINAFASGDVAAAAASLVPADLAPTATGDALVSLTVSDAMLRQLLPTLMRGDYLTYLAPYAMARALPFYPSYPERADADRRTGAYAQVFADFLGLESVSPDTVAQLCAKEFGAQAGISPGLASAEGTLDVGWTARDVLAEADPGDVQDAVKNQVPGFFAQLQARAGDFHAVFPSCVSDFSTLAAQRYGCRVFAGMFVIAASMNPAWLARIPRTVQISWTDAAGKTRTTVAKQGS